MPRPDEAARNRPAAERQIFGAVLVAVVAGIAVLAAFGCYAFIWKTAIIPGLLLAALASRRVDHFVRDWSVFLGAMVLFDFLRGFVFALVTHFDLPVYMHYAIEWERWLCGGQVMPVVLQQWRAGLAHAVLFDRLFTLVHSSHFAFFLLFGLALWLLRPDGFRRYVTAMVLVTYLSVLIYLLVPTVPPWMAAEQFGLLPTVEHVTASIYNSELPSLQKAFDVNPIAAMPSLHAAWPTLGALIAFHQFGWWGLYTAAYAGLALFGIVYLGEHYVVDVVAGGVLSVVAFGVAYLPRRRALARPRWLPSAHPAFVAVVLVLVAEGVGALTFRLGRPFEITQPFVERELAGRTPLAHLHLGRLAIERGDSARAREQLAIATATLESPVQRRYAAALLTRTAYRDGQCGVAAEDACPVHRDTPDEAR